MRKIRRRGATLYELIVVAAIGVWLVVFCGVAYIAVHFMLKFW